MSIRKYKEAAPRSQFALFPASLEDYVSETNPVRAIDAYVDSLDLVALGVNHAQVNDSSRGQPAYDPAMMIKLYLYGYVNHIRSSRRLERESHRNLELLWLLGKLHPCYKSIANFRKNNSDALIKLNKDFVQLCRELKLLETDSVAIDGSFFKAEVGRHAIHTEKQLKKSITELDKKIQRYQAELDQNDEQESQQSLDAMPPADDPTLPEKLEALKTRQAEKQRLLDKLQDSGENQLCTTDADARILQKQGRSTVGYNVQQAVDEKNHLIVASDVTNDGNDKGQLTRIALAAKQALGQADLQALADTGFFSSEQLLTCLQNGIEPYVAEPNGNTSKDKERLQREAFVFDDEHNRYLCPEGKSLEQQGGLQKKHGRECYCYVSQPKNCQDCPKRQHCLGEKSGVRKLYRWEHENIIEDMRERMKATPDAMTRRASVVEHPFGTIKSRLSATGHFLLRGLEKVRGEWSLMVTGYNLTRAINLVGVEQIVRHCQQRRQPA